MKKIPTLFTRIYEGHKIVGIKDEITPGCEDAFKNGIATLKADSRFADCENQFKKIEQQIKIIEEKF